MEAWGGGGGGEAGEKWHWGAGCHLLIAPLHCRVGFGQDREWSREAPLARGRAGGAGWAVGA